MPIGVREAQTDKHFGGNHGAMSGEEAISGQTQRVDTGQVEPEHSDFH